jgi:CheY-like chemotaxis protein
VLLIALTGYGQKEDRAQSDEAGFHHHFVKPADPRHIQGAIAAWATRAASQVLGAAR